MARNLLLILFLSSLASYGQYSIKGSFESDQDFSWILLYKLENGSQTYMDNADVIEGAFEFKIAEKEPSGIFRAYYQIENNLYVEFIYNREEIVFSFDPDDPENSIRFSQSEENNLTREYYNQIRRTQGSLDSLQALFFDPDTNRQDQKMLKNYQQYLSDLDALQSTYEEKSKGKLANHFIRASRQYNPEVPYNNSSDYIAGIKEHFFDAIDLHDTVLGHSSFIHNRLNDYVFYLNQADNMASMNAMHQESIKNALNWIGEEVDILAGFQTSLLEAYLLEENVTMLNYVMDLHYRSLPMDLQDEDLIQRVSATLKTAVGTRAPDFEWDQGGEKKNLYAIKGTDYYIVLFFSSNCPHCQIEIPEFYSFIKGIENIKVIAVGLEDSKESWETMTGGYNEFINILDLDKWSSDKAKNYGVNAIPSYFVLDADKTILAKPTDFKELKSMFETR